MNTPSRPALARQRQRSTEADPDTSDDSRAKARPLPASPPPVEASAPARTQEPARTSTPPPTGLPSWPPPDLTASPAPDSASTAPPEGTLQLLPGRLEIVSEPPEGMPREIRFVRVPGHEPEVSFGRIPGEPYRHVELPSPTVSRTQAVLRFDAGRWTLANHSSTNPTLLNGTPLDGAGAARPVRDGDRIEMGEVVFRFHHPDSADRLPLRSSWFTDQGRRPTNQDAVAVKTLGSGAELAVICDGMGVGTGGEIASHRAIEALVAALETGTPLPDAARVANLAVIEALAGDPDADGAGTTMVALLREGPTYELVNVGDSRAYRLDQRGLHRLTEDHSFVAEVVREGRMTEAEALRTPWKNAVTRHLGSGPDLEIDHFKGFGVADPHMVLLSSDGIHSTLTDKEIEVTLRSSTTIRDLAREVGEEALARGSSDNVTAAVLAFGK